MSETRPTKPAISPDALAEAQVPVPDFVVSRPSVDQRITDESETPDAIRLCVIDLGTNSFHAVIVDAFPDGTFAVVDRRKEMVLLGEGEFVENRLTHTAMKRGMDALHSVKELAEYWGASAYLACATSAIREATNGGQFIDRIRKETGIVVRPIAGETEAQLIYMAVSHAVDMSEPSLLVDIGGGSTEFIVADSNGAHALYSLPLGVQRLTEKFVTTDPVSRTEFRTLRDYLRDQLIDVFTQARKYGVKRVVGSSGSLLCIAQITAAAYGDPDAPAFTQVFDAAHVREVTKQLMGSTSETRLVTPGMLDRRVDQIVSGAILLDVVLKDLGIERFQVSPDALREGIVIDYVSRELKWIRRLAPYRTRRQESVYELAMRLRFDQAHAEHVSRLALQLFDAARSLHHRGEEERELLEFATILHDIGYAISRRNHHKHALYIILEAELQGFSPEEKAVVANVARYHRAGLPKPTHVHFQRLGPEQKQLVLELAAFLRIANGLDRSHFRNVSRLMARVTDDAFLITIYTLADPALDIWAATQGAELFETVFNLPVQIELAGER
ncbi:MAG: Ppx/GppA phosphatase family protein [Rubricoccaceae bacterium]|nr:Ppx/GppA phosphatase family protein [Rubricoccaceae bacterium]